VLPDASVDDGLLDVAVITAEEPVQVARTALRGCFAVVTYVYAMHVDVLQG
jgi:hypothetical protein